MDTTITPHLIDLIYDALLKSFWKRDHLRDFLLQMKVSPDFLVLMGKDEKKRDLLDRLFPKLKNHAKSTEIFTRIASALAEQQSFPKLLNWENSSSLIPDAEYAVRRLKDYLEGKRREIEEAELAKARRAAATNDQQTIQRSEAKLNELRTRLDELSIRIGTSKAGYDFQTWFYDLMDHFEIENRPPYYASGRQIDGSITIEGTTYLVELKFTGDQSDATDIDSILSKVNSKADNTMGLFVSISGYSSVAINIASFAKSPLLLIEHAHLYYILMGNMPASDLILRVRRHSAQEGQAFLAIKDFTG